MMPSNKKIGAILLLFLFLPGGTPHKPHQINIYGHEKIIDLAEECNEITITIKLKNNTTDLDEWDLAINTTKEWGKQLTQTLQKKAPRVEMEVKVSGHCCYKK